MKNSLRKSLMGFMRNKFFRESHHFNTALFALLHFGVQNTEYQTFNDNLKCNKV